MQTIGWKEGLEELKSMFPDVDPQVIEQTLRGKNGHMENTIDALLSYQECVKKEVTVDSDEQLARQIQEREMGMYRAMGGKKSLTELEKDSQMRSAAMKQDKEKVETKPTLQPLDQSQHASKQQKKQKSMWDEIGNSVKGWFSQSESYTALPEDESESKKDR
ncbi:hypothetical protein EIN_418060 [Entamoeba invadens IP1]|uniref:CUE domain-containing protein n=1 Tax=Entamoeba invadens IP1 TaxID=370355 RepID=A0A0A1U501_ENTIV|nr:hypothetical protein EIN_418060 [Entamoeba invadens IP1]ELP87957.1 hypothetical protein EIN_418060 [Entamoeba invadens IP1]|eukprot:XP_004254728.1 hypothetical protein EIN_418060 [Entamoeba invadens IP1]